MVILLYLFILFNINHNFVLVFAPKLLPILRFFNITMIPQENTKFFVSVVKETLKYRRSNDVC